MKPLVWCDQQDSGIDHTTHAAARVSLGIWMFLHKLGKELMA